MIRLTLPARTLLILLALLGLADQSSHAQSVAGHAEAAPPISVPFLESVRITDGQASIEIKPTDIPEGQPPRTVVPLASFVPSDLSSHLYVVRGQVAYDGVGEPGHLEMWSHFGDQKFFTRTLASAGPMKVIHGTSAPRAFELPFSAEPGVKPDRIEINLILHSTGSVRIGPMQLHAIDASNRADAGASSGTHLRSAWWTEQQAGWIGGLLGSGFGIFAGLIGLLAGAGRAVGLARRGLVVLMVCGLLCLLVGAVAVISKQPWHVYYPMLLTGLIVTIVTFTTRIAILHTIRQRELAKMQSADIP